MLNRSVCLTQSQLVLCTPDQYYTSWLKMAMAVDELPEIDFSDFTTTAASTTNSTTTPEDDHCHNWDGWFPVVDWDALPIHPEEKFGDLFDSEMDEETDKTVSYSDDDQNLASSDAMMMEPPVSALSDDCKELRLVHLLMAAAEAMASGNKNHDLAGVILVRLKDLVSSNEGTNMERLTAHFTDALLNLLEGVRGSAGGGGLHYKQTNHLHHHHRDDVLAAFQLLQDMSPYVKFGHFTANQAIIEAVTHERRVHIIDYDIMEGIQWASLMQALISRKDGPPTPHLRITALSRPGSGRKSISTVQETGRRLTAFAASIGQPFSFHQCKLDSDETFKPSSLKLVRGEAIIINCMLHLPHFNHRSPTSVASFLTGSKSLNPKLVTLAEEEGPEVEGGFVGRFMDILHHYSAVYDSLEAGFPMQGRARALVERVFLGPRIVGSVGQVYREEGGGCGSWGDWLKSDPGFQPMKISFANHCQAKLLLGLFNDGYRAEEPASNKLVLGWKSRRLLSASIWAYSESD
ncbi:putative transcription factor GRAS family [Helianthus annuus]|nr:putative transcription factor GRAS family [Helianthus annuus]KAJ0892928.1 putative transcription factor GRAS family [Helianthus annuus]